MSDSIVLVCAVLAAMASGVLTAYVVCLAFFRIFQIQAAKSAVNTAPVVAPQVVQG